MLSWKELSVLEPGYAPGPRAISEQDLRKIATAASGPHAAQRGTQATPVAVQTRTDQKTGFTHNVISIGAGQTVFCGVIPAEPLEHKRPVVAISRKKGDRVIGCF